MSCISPSFKESSSKKGYSNLRKNSISSVIKFISSLNCQSNIPDSTNEGVEEKVRVEVKPSTSLSLDIFIPETSYENLKKMTKDFSAAHAIGEGKFGSLYKTTLKSGREAAVKVVIGHNLDIPDFKRQVAAINQLQHPNLTELLSYTCNDHCQALVYEFAPHGSLYDALHGNRVRLGQAKVKTNQVAEKSVVLSWNERLRIACDAAKGLRYLHDFNASPPLTHKGFKSSNVLIFDRLRSKIVDFDLDISHMNRSRLSSGVLGSFGYNAPESGMMGEFTPKSDVYSFGIVLLEILTGRKPINHKMPKSQISLVKWVMPKLKSSNLEQCIDPNLNSNYPIKDAYKLAELACACVSFETYTRPTMGEVVDVLSLLCQNSTKEMQQQQQE